jgi:hypothetical protein
MFGRKTQTSILFALGLFAAPAYAQQPAQPEQQSESAVPGHGAMMGAGGMPMMAGRGGMMRPAGGMMGAHGMGGQCMMMGGMAGMGMMSAMTGHVEGRLAFLKTELKITDAQLPLWNKFADAVRNNAKTAGKVMQGSAAGFSQSATVPDRLAAREKLLAAQLDALQKLKVAVDPLYAALSAEQKKTADEIMLAPMGVMM